MKSANALDAGLSGPFMKSANALDAGLPGPFKEFWNASEANGVLNVSAFVRYQLLRRVLDSSGSTVFDAR